tara:strand:- start:376 stop:978 length:603 start_codon:yes stop_codon:yes gene_type:complete
MITYNWYRNALEEGACNLFRTIGEDKMLKEARTASGISVTRRSNVAFFDTVETLIVKDNVMPFIIESNTNNNWNYSIDYLEDAQFTTYHSDDHYGWHKDWCCKKCSRNEDGDETGIKGARKISCSILLSSPDEYEGGEFKIENGEISRMDDGVFLKCEDANIKNKGDMVVLKSDTFHRVAPVTKGVRKSLVLWFSGPEFT